MMNWEGLLYKIDWSSDDDEPLADHRNRIERICNRMRERFGCPHIWITRDGHIIPTSLMRATHLVNALRYFHRRLNDHTECYDYEAFVLASYRVGMLLSELHNRNINWDTDQPQPDSE